MSVSLETLEEFDGRIQNLPPAVNQRLAHLAQKLSEEGLSEEHIGAVVSTLVSDLDPTLQPRSESPFKAGTPTDTSQVANGSKNEGFPLSGSSATDDENNVEENSGKSSNSNDTRQSRAGRYRKLPAPCPPDARNVSANKNEK